MWAIETEALRFRYRNTSRWALDGVRFRQKVGTSVVVAGASGAGKSTLCRTINGLIPKFVRGDFRGCVRILGQEIGKKKVADRARHVGLVFQDFEAQLFSTNVTLEVVFGPENLGLPREEMEQRLREALAFVDLKGFERRDPSTLSGGQKQRVAIASIRAMAPDILILDEPTTDLDPVGKRDICRMLFNMMKNPEKFLLTL